MRVVAMMDADLSLGYGTKRTSHTMLCMKRFAVMKRRMP